MNNKNILAWLLIATLGVSGITYASTDTSSTSSGNTTQKVGKMPELTAEQKAEFEAIKTILDKQKAGTTLTTDEQAKLDAFEASHPKMNGKKWHNGEWRWFGGEGRWMWEWFGGGGRWMIKLTDEEKTALSSMTDDEKKTFFETKRQEAQALADAKEAVIDKLIAGETLTDSEKVTLETIKTERAEAKAKKAEMEEIRTILEKQKAGTTLTTDEQAKLTAFEASHPKMDKKFDKDSTTDSGSTTTAE